MSNTKLEYTLADLMICAAASAWDNDGEVLATGIGVIPRLAASLAMLTTNQDLMMTDSEAWLLSEPNQVSGRASDCIQKNETWMGFSRIFDNVWSGKRHAMVGPTQIDQYGQANISCLGESYDRPKVQMLGVRGFPGNSISHANSFYVPAHSTQVFKAGECDMVASIGYNSKRLPKGYTFDDIDIRLVISNLCVMDWNAPNKQLRLVSLHPDVTKDQVIANTGFPIAISNSLTTTKAPTVAQLQVIQQLDPENIRAKQLKNNPILGMVE